MIPKRIVGEATKNWPEEEPEPLSTKFHSLIAEAWKRGYELESWQLARVAHPDQENSRATIINECIVAVFVERPQEEEKT